MGYEKFPTADVSFENPDSFVNDLRPFSVPVPLLPQVWLREMKATTPYFSKMPQQTPEI